MAERKSSREYDALMLRARRCKPGNPLNLGKLAKNELKKLRNTLHVRAHRGGLRVHIKECPDGVRLWIERADAAPERQVPDDRG